MLIVCILTRLCLPLSLCPPQIFRAYPGGFQCLLDTGRGKYRRVETIRTRPALSEFKEIITSAMQVTRSGEGEIEGGKEVG
jgi:hypothetical protein